MSTSSATITPPQDAPPMDTGSNLFNSTWWLYFVALNALVNSFPALIAAAGATAIQTVSYVLAANLAIPAPTSTPAAGTQLKVMVTQDGTGKHSITWASIYKAASVDISPYPNKTTIFSFTAFPDGNFWADADPVRQQ